MKLPALNAYFLAAVLFFATAAIRAFGSDPEFALVWAALGCTMLALMVGKRSSTK